MWLLDLKMMLGWHTHQEPIKKFTIKKLRPSDWLKKKKLTDPRGGDPSERKSLPYTRLVRTDESSVRKTLPYGRLFPMEESSIRETLRTEESSVRKSPGRSAIIAISALSSGSFLRKLLRGQFAEKKAPGITGMIIPVGPKSSLSVLEARMIIPGVHYRPTCTVESDRYHRW